MGKAATLRDPHKNSLHVKLARTSCFLHGHQQARRVLQWLHLLSNLKTRRNRVRTKFEQIKTRCVSGESTSSSKAGSYTRKQQQRPWIFALLLTENNPFVFVRANPAPNFTLNIPRHSRGVNSEHKPHKNVVFTVSDSPCVFRLKA